MTEPPTVTVAELRSLITDPSELAKGVRIVDEGGLAHLARHQHKLFADAAGSQTYKVQIVFGDGPRGRCSCMAARSRPFCKHAAALLVAWARTPEAFAVAEHAPVGAAADKKHAVKASAVDAAALMAQGVAQVATLTRELAVTGAAALAADRAAQVRALGDNLREHKLRRLSAKTIALADLLDGRGPIDESAYADLLGDLVLTARKLDKHLAGEALDPRHVEELIGKTWGAKDRAPVGGLALVEVAYTRSETADQFVIRESRLIDLASGASYAEKQILPRFLVKRTVPKPSRAGAIVEVTDGSAYPSYPPRRLELGSPSTRPLTDAALASLVAAALPDTRTALAALQDQRKDVFAPETTPVVLACARLARAHGRLHAVDAGGAALVLPDDEGLIARLAAALAGVELTAVVGDLSLDGAVPTLRPLAVVVRTRRGLALRSVAGEAPVESAKLRVAAPSRVRWATVARGLGLSTAAVALGEVREELAAILYGGLASLSTRRAEPLVARLRELGLGKAADLLAAVPARPADERLDEVIKLHQLLGMALGRVAGALPLAFDGLTASSQYPSVWVQVDDVAGAPAEIAARQRRGELDRFAAAVAYGRYYQGRPVAERLGHALPTWADAAAAPFVVLAVPEAPELARATALAVLADGGVTGPGMPATVGGAPPRMATVTALRVLEALADEAAVDVLHLAATRHRDHSVRALAEDAVARAQGLPPPRLDARITARQRLHTAASKDERAEAAGVLAELGDVEAAPLLRASLVGDVAADVRAAAARALGRLGDGDAVEPLIEALERRRGDGGVTEAAALALGELGDRRGLDALLAAYLEGWRPTVLAQALAAIGPAVVEQLIAFIEANPGALKRKTARETLGALPFALLRDGLCARLDVLAAGDLALLIERAPILLELARARPQLAATVAAHLLARAPGLTAAGAGKAARALARKAEAAIAAPDAE